MKSPRFISPILLALVLLFAQQAGVMHTLSHTLSEQEQQNKQLPHSPACGQCAAYTQMGSVLNSTASSFLLVTVPAALALYVASAFRSIQLPAAVARGPPLQKIA